MILILWMSIHTGWPPSRMGGGWAFRVDAEPSRKPWLTRETHWLGEGQRIGSPEDDPNWDTIGRAIAYHHLPSWCFFSFKRKESRKLTWTTTNFDGHIQIDPVLQRVFSPKCWVRLDIVVVSCQKVLGRCDLQVQSATLLTVKTTWSAAGPQNLYFRYQSLVCWWF